MDNTKHYDLTPEGMRQAFAECVGSYDAVTEDDVYQLAYMVGVELVRHNRSLGVANVKLDGSYLGGCSVYAPGGHVKYAAISVRFPGVAGLPCAVLFDEDGDVTFGLGMERDTGEVLMLPVFTAFDQWVRELGESRAAHAVREGE